MQIGLLRVLCTVGVAAWVGMVPAAPGSGDAPPHERGLAICFGLETFRHAGDGDRPPPDRFTRGPVDCRAWARVAREAGLKLVLLAAKGGSGFCLWDTAGTEPDIAASPYGRDLMQEFVVACRAEGRVPGVFYGLADLHNEGRLRHQGEVAAPYFRVVHRHLSELARRYPDLAVVMLMDSQRLTAEQFRDLSRAVRAPGGRCELVPSPWDAARHPGFAMRSVGEDWLWVPHPRLRPLEDLREAARRAGAEGKTLILSVGPDTAGVIPPGEVVLLGQLRSSPASAAAPGPARPDTAERLRKLKALLDQRLITQKEYDAKAREILDSL